MAINQSSGSFLGDDFERYPEFSSPVNPPERQKTRKPGMGEEVKQASGGEKKKTRGRPKRSNLPVERNEGPPEGLRIQVSSSDPTKLEYAVSSEERRKAKNIIDDIGKRFSENRLKSQSAAFECYQKDISDNASYIVGGGIMTMKEVSELLMKLEEYRKRTTDQGKTPATLLAEWLRGNDVEGI
jgi:hypothetical protein